MIQTNHVGHLGRIVLSTAKALPIAARVRHEKHRPCATKNMRANVGRYFSTHGGPPHSSGISAPFDLLQVRHEGVKLSGVDGPPREYGIV